MTLTTFRAALAMLFLLAVPVQAQDMTAPIQQLVQDHGKILVKSSRKTIAPAIDALATSGLPAARQVLERWQSKEMWVSKETGAFVLHASRIISAESVHEAPPLSVIV